MSGTKGLLFCDGTLLELIQNRNYNVTVKVDAITEAELLGGNLEGHAASLVEHYRLEPVALLTDKIVTERGMAKIDVRHDWNRMIRDKSRPHYVEGTAITFVVPFAGDPSILKLQPATYSTNPPRGEVMCNEIHVKYEAIEVDPQQVRAQFDENLNNIQQHLSWGAGQISSFNTNLSSLITSRWMARREKLLKERRTAEALGFPLRERPNAPQVYAVPVQRTKMPIAQPLPLDQPSAPDPFLDMAAYDSILQTIGSMARVMELNPKAFREMDEESLRFVLLVPLNIHYEGQATGETFNWQGKTDIIIKVGGRNIFIAECKFWKGAEAFTETIDQLLGYTSWRDTKTAIIIFNRNKNLSAVLAQIPGLVKGHPSFKREVTNYKSETCFRFVLLHGDDKNRELTLTVLVFDVPS